jgi:hypothetical protein
LTLPVRRLKRASLLIRSRRHPARADSYHEERGTAHSRVRRMPHNSSRRMQAHVRRRRCGKEDRAPGHR